jgi:hypothetical protein
MRGRIIVRLQCVRSIRLTNGCTALVNQRLPKIVDISLLSLSRRQKRPIESIRISAAVSRKAAMTPELALPILAAVYIAMSAAIFALPE